MNKYFTDEPKRIVEENYGSIYDSIETEIIKNRKLYSIPKIEENNCIKIINDIPLKKSRGSDGFTMRFIKIFKFSLISHLLLLMNQSIEKSIFPIAWKVAKVFALHKSGNKSEPNNYRPISLLPIFGKIYEKHLETTFRYFLIQNKILSENQLGFRAKNSTIDAIISIINTISKALNSNQKSILITFDLKKAFDCIDHKILLRKLSQFCDNKSIKLFESYLLNRYSFVVHNNKASKPKIPMLSVPQGGCLAPLFFIIYMNDILKLNLNGNLFLFADDMSLIINAKTYSELQLKISSDLKNIGKWLEVNRLVLNYKKSNFMIMGNPRMSSVMDINPEINGNLLMKVESTKILGLEFDHMLKFDSHIDFLSRALNSKFGLFCRLKNFLPLNTLNFLYKSLIKPKVEYGIIAYGFTYAIHIESIRKIQKKFSRLLTNSKFDSHSAPLFEYLDWMSFDETLKYQTLVYIFKSIKGFGSEYTRRIFEFNTNRTSSRRGRDRLHINVPNSMKNFLKNSIFHKGIEFWNSLPLDIREEGDVNSFKNRLKNFDIKSL